MLTQTIGRNRNEYKTALALTATVPVKVFSELNYFRGAEVTRKPAIAEHELDMGKLLKTNSGYRFRVHQNLWFEWSAA